MVDLKFANRLASTQDASEQQDEAADKEIFYETVNAIIIAEVP